MSTCKSSMVRFRNMAVGSLFWFANTRPEEVKLKVDYGVFIDVSNHGHPGNPAWKKRTKSGSKCYILEPKEVKGALDALKASIMQTNE